MLSWKEGSMSAGPAVSLGLMSSRCSIAHSCLDRMARTGQVLIVCKCRSNYHKSRHGTMSSEGISIQRMRALCLGSSAQGHKWLCGEIEIRKKDSVPQKKKICISTFVNGSLGNATAVERPKHRHRLHEDFPPSLAIRRQPSFSHQLKVEPERPRRASNSPLF